MRRAVVMLAILAATSCARGGPILAPGCYVEPSATASGSELIYYPTAVVHTIDGVRVACPEGN